jgi:type II secretory pathway component HofQ
MLQRLAKEAGLKLVLSDRVQGTITMEFDRDTPPRTAIDIIVTAKGLILDEGRDTLYVKTAEERAPEPTERGRYTFRNARAVDVEKLLFRQLRSGVEPSVDERTNTIFYVELRSNVNAIKEFLDFVDQPVPDRK